MITIGDHVWGIISLVAFTSLIMMGSGLWDEFIRPLLSRMTERKDNK